MTRERETPSALRTDDLHLDLPGRSVRSGAAVLVAQGVTVLLGVVSAAVLGRLLTPEDFGLIAMTAGFVAFIANFAELGLPQATVQQAEVTDDQVNALFWINAAVGVAAAAVGLAIAYPVAWFYGEPQLVAVTAALSVAFVVTGLSTQHHALLRRRMRFAVLSAITVGATAGGIAAGIVAAALGAGYWALVVLTLAMALLRAIGYWLACDWRPGRPRRAEGLAPMVRFGAYLTGTNLIGTIARNFDRILIGRVLGPTVTGYYAHAHRILLMPIAQLNFPLTHVAIPTLSRLQDDPERYRLFYRRGLEAIAAVSFPAVLAGLIAADHLVPTLLGDQWDEAIPIFKALAPAALLASVNVATNWVYVPLGRSDRQFRWHLFRAFCVVAAYLIGLRWGAVGVAAALSITACVLRIPAILYCLHGTFVQVSDIVTATWRIAVASAVASAVSVPVAVRLGTDGPHWFALVVLLATFGAGYALGWLVVPGGPRRIAAMVVTARHLVPRRDAGDP
jgi:PST family polysaccharide transporter